MDEKAEFGETALLASSGIRPSIYFVFWMRQQMLEYARRFALTYAIPRRRPEELSDSLRVGFDEEEEVVPSHVVG